MDLACVEAAGRYGSSISASYSRDVSAILGHLQDLASKALEEALSDCSSEYLRLEVKSLQNCLASKPIVGMRSDILQQRISYIRESFRLVGSLRCRDTWQSPTYQASLIHQNGKERCLVTSDSYQYHRDYHHMAELYEDCYSKLYSSGNNHFFEDAFLTNSGMSAFLTCLNFVLMSTDSTSSILVDTAVYHECKHILVETLGDRVVQFDGSSSEELCQLVEDFQPEAVFADTLSNSFTIRWAALRSLVRELNKLEKRVFLVLDNTCLSSAFNTQLVRSSAQDHIELMVHESLLKHYQYGLDLVSAGAIFVSGTADTFKEFYRCRAKCGTNIGDSAAASLPPIHRGLLTQRLLLIGKNLEFLASSLQSMFEELDIQQMLKIHRAPQNPEILCSELQEFSGACLHIELLDRDISEGEAGDLITKAISRARVCSIPLHAGQSFGFFVTRMCFVGANNKHCRPFLRVAVGLDDHGPLKQLAFVISQSLATLLSTEAYGIPID